MPSAEKQEWHSYSVSLRLRSGLWSFYYAQGSGPSTTLRALGLRLRSGSILNTTYRVSGCSTAGEHVGTAATEAEEASSRAANCSTPIAAEGTDRVERTTGAAAAARHGQFKRRGKSTCCILATPTCAFVIKFGFGW